MNDSRLAAQARVAAVKDIRSQLGCGLREAVDLYDNHKKDWKDQVESILSTGKTYEGPLEKVRMALRGYYHALDRHEHGGVAASVALDKIQEALGMEWVRGATLENEKEQQDESR